MREIAKKGIRCTIITSDNQLIVLDEMFLPEGVMTNGSIDIKLGPDQYFLLGDNRFASKDSRSFGPVDKAFITGKVLFRGWPVDKILISDNDYWQV